MIFSRQILLVNTWIKGGSFQRIYGAASVGELWTRITGILRFRIPVRWSIYFINSVDKTKFLLLVNTSDILEIVFRSYRFDLYLLDTLVQSSKK